jgi:hypothetical protein
MTVNRNDVITLPKWLVIIVLPMIISLASAYGLHSATEGKNEVKIENLQKETEKKVNKSEVDTRFESIQKQLDRIENKLDNTK